MKRVHWKNLRLALINAIPVFLAEIEERTQHWYGPRGVQFEVAGLDGWRSSGHRMRNVQLLFSTWNIEHSARITTDNSAVFRRILRDHLWGRDVGPLRYTRIGPRATNQWYRFITATRIDLPLTAHDIAAALSHQMQQEMEMACRPS